MHATTDIPNIIGLPERIIMGNEEWHNPGYKKEPCRRTAYIQGKCSVMFNKAFHGVTRPYGSLRGFVLICTPLLGAGCCLLCPKPIEDWPAEGGLVVDADTGAPIPGAYVIGRWKGYVSSQSVCFHAEGRRTDTEGRFELPAWRNTGPFTNTSYQQYSPRCYLGGI